MMDAGHIAVCDLINTGEEGQMPVEMLEIVTEADFEERVIGLTRQYAAKGVNEHIDLLARIWRDGSVRIGMYGVVTDSEYDGQYRITNVQHLLDDDGLKVTDITCERINRNYEITAGNT